MKKLSKRYKCYTENIFQTGETLILISGGILGLVCPQNPRDDQSQTHVECENFEIAERFYSGMQSMTA